ncbi:MAG: DUF2634 domain-containing protein [Oscillospiraceae bacterium]
MKGFAMDETGDVVIANNEIMMVTGSELMRQQVQNVLRTNLEEWFLDLDEGIDYHNIIGKGITEELIRYEIERGLTQVDSTFAITEFACNIDNTKRKATVDFQAVTDTGGEVGGVYTWA